MSKFHDFMIKNEHSGNYLQKIALKVYSWCCENKILHYFRYRAWMDDKKYICLKYKHIFGVEPNLDNPKNFNEKSNWRKLHDRNPYYTRLVDKYTIKKEIEKKVGSEYTFSLLGVWENACDIDFTALPDRFVLKGNHSGGVIVCRDKNSFDNEWAIEKLAKGQNLSGYYASREWPYKDVPRRIIAEEYMGENLTDYKNYCFNGKLAYTFVWENQSRGDGQKPEASFCGAYDRLWNKTTIDIDYPSKDKIVDKPECYADLVRVVEKMAHGISFVRVDCYIINNHVYVGEMTFFPWGGFEKFKDESWNRKLGDLVVLPYD